EAQAGSLAGHEDDVEDFTFVEDRYGASASRDHKIVLWDLATRSVLRVLAGHDKDVLSLTYAEGRLYSSGDDMTLRVWDVGTGELLRTWGPFETETDTCAVDAARDLVVLGSDDGAIRSFALGSGAARREVQAHASGIKKVATSAANGRLLSAAYDQRIVVWDTE